MRSQRSLSAKRSSAPVCLCGGGAPLPVGGRLRIVPAAVAWQLKLQVANPGGRRRGRVLPVVRVVALRRVYRLSGCRRLMARTTMVLPNTARRHRQCDSIQHERSACTTRGEVDETSGLELEVCTPAERASLQRAPLPLPLLPPPAPLPSPHRYPQHAPCPAGHPPNSVTGLAARQAAPPQVAAGPPLHPQPRAPPLLEPWRHPVVAVAADVHEPVTNLRCLGRSFAAGRPATACSTDRQDARTSAQVCAHLCCARCCGISASPASGAIQQRRHRRIADARQRA